MGAIKAREQERAQLERRHRDLKRAIVPRRVDQTLDELKVDVERWRGLLRTTHVPQARRVLRKVLRTRIVFKPEARGEVDGVAFWAEGSLKSLLEGFVPGVHMVASPAGFEPALPP